MKLRLWRAWLSEDARRTIIAAAERAHPNETGGVLVGVLNRRRPWITEAIELPSPASNGTCYLLDGEARRAAVEAAQTQVPAVGYLGEWHSHPADVGPSTTDLATMKRLANDPDSGRRRPLLLIARRTGTTYRLDAREVSRLGHRPLRLVAAGTLAIDSVLSSPTMNSRVG